MDFETIALSIILLIVIFYIISLIEKFKNKLENRKKQKEDGISYISERIQKISRELNQIEKDLNKKIEIVKTLEKEAEDASAIKNLSKEQIDAIDNMIGRSHKKGSKKSWVQGIIVGLIFYILGLITQYLIEVS